jgi:hypothetical protein
MLVWQRVIDGSVKQKTEDHHHHHHHHHQYYDYLAYGHHCHHKSPAVILPFYQHPK